MLWGSIEGTASNGDLAKNTNEDSWASIGGSGNDQIVCQWNNDRTGNDYSWSFVGVYDYFGGQPDQIDNVEDGWNQVAPGTDQTDGNLACVFQRAASQETLPLA